MKLGVILLNLGGPAQLHEVKPFLYRLFLDPDIIPIPFSRWLRKPMAYTMATLRRRMSEGYYRAIGGGSPLQAITQAQAAALRKKLMYHFKDVSVAVAMRYWNPSSHDAVGSMIAEGVSDLVVLPLYPHYSQATTGSSFKALKECSLPFKKISWISDWHDHPKYLEAFREKIQTSIDELSPSYRHDFDLIFSAHSLPLNIIQSGDPYDRHIRETIRLLLAQLNGVSRWHLSYQSKTGPIRWLKPSTSNLLVTLSRQRKRALVVVPISFVSDHVETLYEIDILYKKEAEALGFPLFKRVDSLNTSDAFIDALDDLVLKEVQA